MSLPMKDWTYKWIGYTRGLKGEYVKSIFMSLGELKAALLNAQRTVQAFRGLLAQNSKATAMLLQKQIATERERERAQRQIGEAMRASDYNYEAYKLENAKVADLSAQLANAERERDNARAALSECQKVNATLREKLELEREINRRHCDEWAEDDTAIREIAAKFIPQEWIDGDSYYVPSMVECVGRLAEKLRSHQRMAASGVYVKTAEYAAECDERRDLRRQLEEITKDRDAQRAAWNAAESEMWLGELRAQLTAMTAERDELNKGINDTIDELQAGKISSIPGGPRTEWGVGCDAGKDKAIQILIRRTKWAIHHGRT